LFRKFFLGAFIVFFSVIFHVSCGLFEVKEGEALNIAETEIKRYSMENDIPLADFLKPEISSGSQFQWTFDYQTKKYPKHFVRVLINGYGGAEVQRIIDEKEELPPKGSGS